MESNDICYSGCPTCPCTEVDGTFNKNICQSNDDIKTLLDAKFNFKITNPEVRQGSTCVYQARVKIYGKASSTLELLIPKNIDLSIDSSCIGSSDEGFSDIFEITFPSEIELMSEVDEFRNYSFDGNYKEFEVEVEIYRNTSANPYSKNCEDYSIVDKETCDQDSDDEDACICSWKSSSEDFSYEGDENDYLVSCKVPRCYPCGHDATGTANIDVNEVSSSYDEDTDDSNTDDVRTIRSYYTPTVYPFYSNFNVDYFVKGMKVYTKPLSISCATEYKPGEGYDNVCEIRMKTTELGVPISNYDEIEVEINPSDTECECDCLFGWKELSGSKNVTEYVPENKNNSDLVENELNYLNSVCAIGNCKSKNDSGETITNYWFRYSLKIANLLENRYGHNCKYNASCSFSIGSSEKYSETIELDLSKLVKDIDIDERSKIKSFSLEKTIKLEDVNSPPSISDSQFKVCILDGSPTDVDGYTKYGKSVTYEHGCCQEYGSRYFNSYIEDKPENCIPCQKSNAIQTESLSYNSSSQIYYNAEIADTFLMYANVDVAGETKKVLIGNGTNETFEHKILIDTLSEDEINKIGYSGKISHEEV